MAFSVDAMNLVWLLALLRVGSFVPGMNCDIDILVGLRWYLNVVSGASWTAPFPTAIRACHIIEKQEMVAVPPWGIVANDSRLPLLIVILQFHEKDAVIDGFRSGFCLFSELRGPKRTRIIVVTCVAFAAPRVPYLHKLVSVWEYDDFKHHISVPTVQFARVLLLVLNRFRVEVHHVISHIVPEHLSPQSVNGHTWSTVNVQIWRWLVKGAGCIARVASYQMRVVSVQLGEGLFKDQGPGGLVLWYVAKKSDKLLLSSVAWWLFLLERKVIINNDCVLDTKCV